MGEIFVSYAREDAARVEVLAHCLENHGWTVFWDRRIPAGTRWHDVLSAALSRADWVIVAWSTTSVNSAFVRDEAQVGADRGRLLPLLLDDVRMPLGFGQIQTADFTAFDGDASSEAFQTLLRDLGPPDARRSSTAATAHSIPDVVEDAPVAQRLEAHASQEPEASAEPPRGTTRARSGAGFGIWPAVVGVVALVAAVVVWIAASSGRQKTDPVATTGASSTTTGAAPTASTTPLPPTTQTDPSAPVKPAASDTAPNEDAAAEEETKHILTLLRSYYQDLNGGTFQASKYFAPTVARYITMRNTTPQDIDAYVNGQLPKQYSSYRAEMDEATLVRTAPRTFEYRETTRVVEKGAARNLSAKVHVQAVRITRNQAAGLGQPVRKVVVAWRLSTFETSAIKVFLAPDVAKKLSETLKRPPTAGVAP